MQQRDLVSVIMPTYNSGKFLSESVESILNQTYRNLELLITDDASTDKSTIQMLKELASKDKRVDVLFLKENLGPGNARNQSIARAKGRYIAFCDSDDRWSIDKLEKQIAFMTRKRCALSCAAYLRIDEHDRIKGFDIPPRVITYSMMKRDNKVGCLTAIYDTQLLGHKFYMPYMRNREDWALFLQIMKECGVCHAYTESPLAYYRIREDSISSRKISLIKYNIAVYTDILGFGKVKAYLYFFTLFMPTYTLKLIKQKLDLRKIRYSTFCQWVCP